MSRKRPKMAGGKRLPNPPSPKAKELKKKKQESHLSEEEKHLRLQRIIASVGFGFCGALVGFLTGANQLAPLPAELGSLASLNWTAAEVGLKSLNWGLGLQGLALGASVGSSVGFSVLLTPLVMLGSWLCGGALLWLGLKFTGSLLVAAVGWLVGFVPFLVKELQKG